MAIFARRVVQRNLDVLRRNILVPNRERDLIGKLNCRNRHAIAAEWEIALIASFARQAAIEYEPLLGTKNPDLRVQFQDSDSPVEFIADILTVSDAECDIRNPIDYLLSEIRRVTSKLGLSGGFDIRIDDSQLGKYPDAHIRLLIPSKREIPQFVKETIKPFLKQVKASPSNQHSFRCQQASTHITIGYDPKQAFNTANHAAAAAPRSLTRNPLFVGLDNKARDLSKTRYQGHRGIIVVDGGCHTLRSANPGLGGFSRDQIVEEFLRKHSSIAFVTTTHHELRGGFSRLQHTLSHKFYWQRLNNTSYSAVHAILSKGFASLPPVVAAPANARFDVCSGQGTFRGCKFGAYSWIPQQRLSISSRMFVGLLAGIYTDDDLRLLVERPNRNDGHPIIHFFTFARGHGSQAHTYVEYFPDQDDDSIVISLRGPPPREPAQEQPVATCQLPFEVSALM